MIKRILTEKDVIKVESLFVDLNVLGTRYFREPKKPVFLHSAPFVDEEAYPLFMKLINTYKNKYVDIIGMPLIIGADYLRFHELPASFEDFNEAMIETELVYTGGVGFTDNGEVQFVSCPDTELVILNLPSDDRLHQNNELLSSSIVSEREAENIVASHKAFLKSVK